VADLTKPEDWKRAIQETIDKLGGLDILINKFAPALLSGMSTDACDGNQQASHT
jgi:NAD(P)-dependent dehydrogenase (short-subunit alcohol dehydrogenase family)